MSDFEKQLNKAVKATKMTAAEKRDLRARVVSYMEYHPRREKVAAEKAAAYIESQPYTLISIHNRMVQAAVGAFAVFVLVVVPAVAEQSVPGDVLYPIKVRVNEEVRSTFTFNATEKIEWETERLERRISEVRLLAEEGKLTEETEAQAVEAVKEHAEAAQDGINKLKESDVDAATLAEVEFESALEVQTAVLDAGQKESSTTAEATDGISEVVKEAQETVEATKGAAIPAFDRIAARLEIQSTRAYELFESLNDVVSDAERAEIERRLQDIERKVESGVVKHEAERVVPDVLLEALADTQKLISFMTDIDVRASVELEELVPVQLTDEEKQAIVAEQIAFASSTIAAFNAADNLDADVATKAQAGVDQLIEMLAELETAQEASDLETQVRIGAEVEALARDIETLIERDVETPVVEPVETDPATTTEEVIAEEEETGSSTEEVIIEEEIDPESDPETPAGEEETEIPTPVE